MSGVFFGLWGMFPETSSHTSLFRVCFWGTNTFSGGVLWYVFGVQIPNSSQPGVSMSKGLCCKIRRKNRDLEFVKFRMNCPKTPFFVAVLDSQKKLTCSI